MPCTLCNKHFNELLSNYFNFTSISVSKDWLMSNCCQSKKKSKITVTEFFFKGHHYFLVSTLHFTVNFMWCQIFLPDKDSRPTHNKHQTFCICITISHPLTIIHKLLTLPVLHTHNSFPYSSFTWVSHQRVDLKGLEFIFGDY